MVTCAYCGTMRFDPAKACHACGAAGVEVESGGKVAVTTYALKHEPLLKPSMKLVRDDISAVRTLFYLIVVAFSVVWVLAWAWWQFSLCYPSVSDSVWYCIQHAG